jgi:hypothetical protein
MMMDGLTYMIDLFYCNIDFNLKDINTKTTKKGKRGERLSLPQYICDYFGFSKCTNVHFF